jgi:gas vesicle protein
MLEIVRKPSRVDFRAPVRRAARIDLLQVGGGRREPAFMRRRRRRRAVGRMQLVLIGVCAGAAAEFLLDPASGKRRRHVAWDRTGGAARRMARRATRAVGGTASYAAGKGAQLRHSRSGALDLDDATLANKVRTELFRDPEVPKGQLLVQAHDGVVELRGEVEGLELIDELVRRARDVRGVRSVENLLHAPGTPAPHGGGTASPVTPASPR